jgi:hypothetical protein
MRRITDAEFNARPARGQRNQGQYVDWIRSLELEKGPVVLQISELPEKLQTKPMQQYHAMLASSMRTVHGQNAALAFRTFPGGKIGLALRPKVNP